MSFEIGDPERRGSVAVQRIRDGCKNRRDVYSHLADLSMSDSGRRYSRTAEVMTDEQLGKHQFSRM